MHSQDWHLDHALKDLLTYADEFAIGYFEKQGFSRTIDVPRDVYAGYIKEYEGATLMASRLDARLRYTQLSEMLRKQRQLLAALVPLAAAREYSGAGGSEAEDPRRVFPGLDCFHSGLTQIPIESIPGAIAAGYTPPPPEPNAPLTLDILRPARRRCTVKQATESHNKRP